MATARLDPVLFDHEADAMGASEMTDTVTSVS
jgi:hypothetical protein